MESKKRREKARTWEGKWEERKGRDTKRQEKKTEKKDMTEGTETMLLAHRNEKQALNWRRDVMRTDVRASNREIQEKTKDRGPKGRGAEKSERIAHGRKKEADLSNNVPTALHYYHHINSARENGLGGPHLHDPKIFRKKDKKAGIKETQPARPFAQSRA